MVAGKQEVDASGGIVRVLKNPKTSPQPSPKERGRSIGRWLFVLMLFFVFINCFGGGKLSLVACSLSLVASFIVVRVSLRAKH